jgi:hypothetical protein
MLRCEITTVCLCIWGSDFFFRVSLFSEKAIFFEARHDCPVRLPKKQYFFEARHGRTAAAVFACRRSQTRLPGGRGVVSQKVS